MSVLLAFCACPTAESADAVAHALVDERLAACVSRIAAMRSVYRWKGEVVAAEETLLMIKTSRDRFEALKARLPGLHPYEVPELVAFEAADGLAAYLDWVNRETSMNAPQAARSNRGLTDPT